MACTEGLDQQVHQDILYRTVKACSIRLAYHVGSDGPVKGTAEQKGQSRSKHRRDCDKCRDDTAIQQEDGLHIVRAR